MKMKTSQKRAIWYVYQAQQNERQDQIIEEYNLDFKKSGYKSKTWFLKDCKKKGLLPLQVYIY